MSNSDTPTVVLVHGGFVDGSGWQGVYEHLTKDGYDVAIVGSLCCYPAGSATL